MQFSRREAVVLAFSSIAGFRALASSEADRAEREAPVHAERDERLARSMTIAIRSACPTSWAIPKRRLSLGMAMRRPKIIWSA